MLGDDKAEQRAANRIRLPIQPTILVFSPIQIMRRERDEAALGQFCCEVIVSGGVVVDRITRDTVSPVLANDHRAAFSWLHVFRDDQCAPREQRIMHVQNNIPGRPFVGFGDLPRAGVG